MRCGGICTKSSGSFMSPLASSSSRVSRLRMIRKEEGTIPDASPECTPSFSTRTFSVPAAMPRSDVVSHIRSQSPQPESRQTTSDGSPMRSSRWST